MTIGPDFDTVLQAARVGAEWAWTSLYRDMSPPVLRYLRAHGVRSAEDLLGDTFVQVVRGLPGFSGGEPQFRAWVFAVARNRMLDEFRREKRRPVEYVGPDDLHALDVAPSAEDEAMRRIAHDRVRLTLSHLTRDQRDVVFLRVIAGLSIEEVAQVLGKNGGAVKSLQMRGLAAIRREISGEAVS